MNIRVIRDTVRQLLEGSTTFPQIVATLLAEGAEAYHVDFVRGENRYYTSDGQTLVEPVELEHGRAADHFSAEGVQKAIKASQAGKISYKEFVRLTLEAGTVYYIAYLKGKRVIYFGREGDFHIEHFPGANDQKPRRVGFF